MDKQDEKNSVDEDLFEEIDDAELLQLVEMERQKILAKEQETAQNPKTKHRFPKWAVWLIAIAMVFNLAALIPRTFSIPAIDFLQTSVKLSQQDQIKTYKQAVVVVETEDSKGTGFNIAKDGLILTNHHVVADNNKVTVAFPEYGLFQAAVIADYPDTDLAVLQVENNHGDLPCLTLAEQTNIHADEPIYFIGNPLYFHGIANKGTIISYTQLPDWTRQVVMMDAPVYQGNSGSPVINMDGKVIGVVFATSKSKKHGKVGLFIPIDYYQAKLK